MDVKIENEPLRLDSYKNTKSTNKSSNNTISFGECLDNSINEIQKSFDLHEKEDSSGDIKSAIATIKRCLKIDITEKDYKDNGKLDIMGIIKKYGDKLSTRDIKDFKDSLDVLWDKGAIDTEDYFEAVKWLSLRNISNNLDSKSEEELLKIGTEI